MRIGPYDILLELGRGGMGAVYLARLSGDGEFERLVAVKRALPQSLADDGTRERFLHEAKLAACVHHANVVGIHQVGSDAVGPYLACDFVEGESLSGLVERAKKDGGVPPRVVLRIIVDALAGLAAVHDAVDSRGRRLEILHRDVSVENLLVGLDGVTRITDFGIAKSSASPIKTATGTIHGKLLYLAPEYLAGEEPPDRSCDLYAMGITIFSALTATYPYPIDDVTVLIEHIHTQPLPSLASRGVEAPPELEAVLQKACHRERAGRFHDAREMLDALERAGQAWTGVARQQEVADFVERVAGEPLRARRGMLSKRSEVPPSGASTSADARTGPAPIASLPPLAAPSPKVEPWHAPAPALVAPLPETPVEPVVLPRASFRVWWLAALALLGVGAGAGAFLALQGGASSAPSSPLARPEEGAGPVAEARPSREPSAPVSAPPPVEPPAQASADASVDADAAVSGVLPVEGVPGLELAVPGQEAGEAVGPGGPNDLPTAVAPPRARGARGRAGPASRAVPEAPPTQNALPPGLKPLDLDGGATDKPGRRSIAVDNPYR